MKLTNSDSETFRVASLLATVLVVAIHYNTRHHISISDGIGFNIWFQTFLTDGIARIAVPFFAFSAGLFFFLGEKNTKGTYKKNLKQRFHSLLIPYVICIALIIIPEYAYRSYLHDNYAPITLHKIIVDAFVAPVAVQFWFLRDLLVLTIVSPVVALISTRFSTITLTILTFFWFVSFEPFPAIMGIGRPLISIEVLYLFCFGCYVSSKGGDWIERLLSLSKKYVILLMALMLILFAARVQLDFQNLASPVFGLIILALFLQKLGILIGVYVLLLISSYLKNKLAVNLSSFNFFVYIFHGIPLIYIINFSSNFLLDDAYRFYLNFPIALVLSFGAAFLLKRFANAFYNRLVGGR